MAQHVQRAFRCNTNIKRLTSLLLTGCMVVPAMSSANSPLSTPHTSPHADVRLQTTISGIVRDADGSPMAGVTVRLKRAGTTATTDDNGRYQLTLGTDNDLLVFSFVGYLTQEIAINDQTTQDAIMAEDTQALDEVVVVGYGTQRRATVTGSVSDVKGADLVKSPQPNLSNSLAGRFSGLVATNRGGEPGYDGSQLRIRGASTTGNTDVLVVVDGIPGQVGGLERLDPNDIESVTILKDAAAAVYGSRAANGVILVTTRKGDVGKPTVSYSFNQGFSSPTRLPSMADAATYAAIRNEIDYYSNPSGGMNQFYSEADIQKFRDGSDPDRYPNTDWQQEVLAGTALQNQHNLSVSGGTERTRYFVSAGTLMQDGLFKEGVTKYNQYNFRSNIDMDVTERFKAGLSLAGREEKRRFPTVGAGDIFRSIYRAYPTQLARYANGLPSTGIENNNPVMMVTDAGGINQNPKLVFNGILRASYELPFLAGLMVDGFLAVDRSQESGKNFITPYLVYSHDATTGAYDPRTVGEARAQLQQFQQNTSLTTAHIKLNYEQSFGDHNVKAFAAYEQSERELARMEAGRRNFPSSLTPELSQGGTALEDRTNAGLSWRESRVSFISRANYDYKQRYLLEVQLRVDGSSIFPQNSRFGYFPGVSAGWRLSDESWFNANFIDELKLRASYGELGGDNVGANQFINNYVFNNAYTIGNSIYAGIDLAKLANPSITWEVSRKTDVGLNARLFNRFDLEFIYFNENRSGILLPRNASIPGVTGIVNPFDANNPLVPSENIGKVDNRGIEATVGYQHRGPVNFGIAGNITLVRSNVVFRDEAPGIPAHQRETSRPLNTYLLYRTLGIFRTTEDLTNYPHVPGAGLGDLIFEDYNQDGEITADDMVRTDLGNIPQLTFGLTLNASYKNFDFSAVFAGQGKSRQYILSEAGTIGNYFNTWAENRWSPSNTDGSYPKVNERASSAISGGLYRNDFWLFNTAFVRLKNIELGYTLPETVIQRVGLGRLRVYASGFNVFTLTGLKDFDPEGSSESGQFYPQQRIFNLGINVGF
ncbi:SusC/RagA family TonB-linked outer membrane protein [Parapedobacter pyrenivorans]|uniref:SusC/RagA family TonB-linked outer membrane protein n=1 Tax=Parapedobacter pyrenivorans TaxID=1305674 RepID=A0A917HU10_9SPHI|nr:TonB-dependent receptor [Parapedobacter pyrenivorans]GGG89272.1 SusC/RagA family TonB-linked outer membrane protein [Parapedobacter pyrenivorans]